MMEKFEILYRDTNSVLKINATAGETYTVEAGAMVSMSDVFDIKAKTGSMGKALGRMFSGESMFVQNFIARENGELLLAPKYLGDIETIEMDGTKNYRLGKSSFLASTSGIDVVTKNGKMKGFLSGEGLIQMEAVGTGTLFVSCYGAIHKKDLLEGETYLIDSGHLVLWDSNLRYTTELASGFLNSVAGGEGIVCKFTGPGAVWIQTRNPENIVAVKK